MEGDVIEGGGNNYDIIMKEESPKLEMDKGRSKYIIVKKPVEIIVQHLKLIYICTHFDEKLVNRV